MFSGGGARGAWEAGVAAALIERGVPVRAAAGSSSGALNAVMVADGRIDRLEALWRSLTRERVYSLRPSVFFAGLLPGWLTALTLSHTTSLLDPAPLRELLAEAIDLERVRASPLRLVVVTTDLARREARLFDNQTITHDALLATVAVPGLFPPVEVDGAPRWKGTTPADDDFADPPPLGCTMTWLAVMVVPFVVPSTRTLSPSVTALAELELVPFWYVVEDVLSTVTF